MIVERDQMVLDGLDDIWQTFDEVWWCVLQIYPSAGLTRAGVAATLRGLVRSQRAFSRVSDAHGRVEYARDV